MTESKAVRLGDVADVFDCEHKTAPTQNNGYPLIRTPNIGRGRFILSDVKKVSQEIYEQWTRRSIPSKGDLIFAREAPVGNVAVIKDNEKYCLGQRTVLIKPNQQKVDSEYLCYLILAPEIQSHFSSRTNGATVGHFNLADLRNLNLDVLPPLPTQKKIAKVLGDLDDKIELNRRMNETLEEMAMAVYRHYFVNFGLPPGAKEEATECPFGKLIEHPEMGMVPDGWSVGKIKDFGRVVTGKTPPTDHAEYYNGKTPFITPTDYKNYQKYLINSDRSISDFGKSKFNSLIISKGSIMITCIGSDMGKIALTSCDVMTNQQINSIVPFDSICCEYLYNFLKSIYEQLTLWARTGTTMPIINKSSFENISLLVPTEKVLLQFTKDILKSSELVLKNSQEIQSLTATRDYLLPRLLSGDVRVE
jgi:type I restriction enzyme S subunit